MTNQVLPDSSNDEPKKRKQTARKSTNPMIKKKQTARKSTTSKLQKNDQTP